MSASGSGRTELGSEETALVGPSSPQRHADDSQRENRMADSGRRRCTFTSKDILQAEELKTTVMSLVEDGAFTSLPPGLDRAWPELTGSIGRHRPSLAEQLDAARRRDLEKEIEKLGGTGRTTNRNTQSMVGELREQVAELAARIPELPMPCVDQVPDSIVIETYKKQDGHQRNRVPCGLCVNCGRNEARAGPENSARAKRRKTTRRPCLTVSAVTKYEAEMGYLNGNDMLRIVETMQRAGAGATGRGVRCGKCRQCLALQNQEKKSAKCFVAAAVHNGTVPARLLSIVKLAAAGTEDRMLLSYPYIKQVEELRLTGIEWLMKRNQQKNRRRGRDGVEGAALIDPEEALRWGLPNLKCPEQRGSRSEALNIGNILHGSKFGEAVVAFDEALLTAIRERQALTGAQHSGGDERDAARGGPTLSSSADDRSSRVLKFAEAVVADVMYTLHSASTTGSPEPAGSSDSFLPTTPSSLALATSLATLHASIIDWGQEPPWMEAMIQAWSCPQLCDQMAHVVAGSRTFAIKSFLAHCIHSSRNVLNATRRDGAADPSRDNATDMTGSAETLCHTCGVDHGTTLPSWRVDPVLVKLNDANHDNTPRVLDDVNFTPARTSHEYDGNEDLPIARVTRSVRGPLYRLIEATLNELAAKVALQSIPTQFRNKNAGDKRIFRERTDIAAFPSLPRNAEEWYTRGPGINASPASITQITPEYDPKKLASVVKRVQHAANRIRMGRRSVSARAAVGRTAVRTDRDGSPDDDNNAVNTLNEMLDNDKTLQPSPDSAFHRCGEEESPQPNPASHNDQTDLVPGDMTAGRGGQQDNQHAQYHQQSIDALLDLVPNDVRLLFLACRGMELDEKLVRRSIQRYIATARPG